MGSSRSPSSIRPRGCTIGALSVTGARLTGFDLTGATLRTLRGVGSLKGAIISRDQLQEFAPLLAAHMGLEVRD